jgi:signal transduction histidine kinase/CheY-like chemotaxis protein
VEILVPEASQGIHGRLRSGYMAEPRTRPMGAGLALAARRKDGSEFPVDISLAAMQTDQGLLVAAAIRDLTQQMERERLEHQLQQTRRLESLGLLAGGVAHDFNNLMGVIDGYAGFIAEDAHAATAEGLEQFRAAVIEEAEHIRKAVGRATHLTRQLLAFGRRELTRPELVDLNAVVRDTVNLLERTLGEHITVVTSFGADLAGIMADAGQLEQVIVNTAVNARDAMPTGGMLTIDTSSVTVDEAYAAESGASPGPYVRLRIADTGTGMTEETLTHVFEPFFTTKPTGHGTGLGLSTVYGIVARHGGHIAVYSEPDHGSTFSILLPATPDQAVPATAAPGAPVPTVVPADDEVRTILVVDDEAGMREVASRIIARAGYRVLVAPDGPHALALAREHPGPIDLLLTDVIMPRMLGKELAETLRRTRPGLRMVYMSGYAQPVLTAQGTLDPGTSLVEKPFTEAQLLGAIRAALVEAPPR